jgi:predicted transposase/invertase (TIGR01784 family)
MKEEVMYPQQGNRYDKILKENMESALPVIIKDVLDLDISDSEEIPDDLQQTNERKPDVLKKVRDQHNNTFVLHIEWQSQNEKDMVYRMAEYAVMPQRKYRIPVKQYVLFIGKGALRCLRV